MLIALVKRWKKEKNISETIVQVVSHHKTQLTSQNQPVLVRTARKTRAREPPLALRYLCSPHEPQLEDVHVASTLQRFVSGVVGQVVVFVLLEQVAGVHLVAVLHQTL